MLRRIALLCAVCALWLGSCSASQVEPELPQLRALLIGVDRFQTYPDTRPAAENNLTRLARAFSGDIRGYQRMSLSHNQIGSLEGLEALVSDSFSGAGQRDLSLFYIATHGILRPGDEAMDFAMLLSDGEREYPLTARELYGVLSRVPGRKLLIIDTCNAGALIDRGMPGDGLDSLFTTQEFRVITASGGSEPSFFWSAGQGSLRGGSYFADALANGISRAGNYAADANRDGDITLEELHGYLIHHYGVSTPQVYPRGDQSVVLSYAKPKDTGRAGLLTDLVLEQHAFSAADPELRFAFTLNGRARLAHQLVYHKGAAWQFTAAQVMADGELPSGESLPGRQERALRVSTQRADQSGYVLLMVTSVEEDSATPLDQALLSVEPLEGDPGLGLSQPMSFIPALGQELPFRLAHRFPMRVTLVVENQAGEQVASVASAEATRPMHLPGGGSLFYWNGKTPSGELLPPGLYRARLTARAAGRQFSLSGDWFRLQ